MGKFRSIKLTIEFSGACINLDQTITDIGKSFFKANMKKRNKERGKTCSA